MAAEAKFQALLNSTLMNGNQDVLKHWIEQQVNTKDQNQQTALHKATRDGHLNTVKYLIQIGAQVNVKDEIKGFTPLHIAGMKGHLEIVQCLIHHGADIEAKTKESKQTPLILAAGRGHLEVVKCLIDNGAQIDGKDIGGSTPLLCSFQVFS